MGCTVGETKTKVELNDYIGYLYKFSIALAVLMAIVVIIYGGFEYMTSDSISSKSDAKAKFTNAATGLLMILASYLILRTIDPRLVNLTTSIEPVNQKSLQPVTSVDQLAESLRYATLDAQGRISYLSTNIDIKNKRIKELNDQLESRNANNLTEEELLELHTLQQQVSEMNAQRALILADGTAANQSALMSSTLNEQTQQAIKTIDQNYDAAIKLLDPQKNAAEILELRNRKAFFADQTNVISKIESHGTKGNTGGAGTYTIDNSAYLNGKVNEYKNALKNLGDTQFVTDAAHKATLEGRITQITEKLKPAPKK